LLLINFQPENFLKLFAASAKNQRCPEM